MTGSWDFVERALASRQSLCLSFLTMSDRFFEYFVFTGPRLGKA